jgi:hypothetical protein
LATRFEQKCVLCGRPAEYCLADYDKRKHFLCQHCTEYQITDTAEAKLATAPQEWRDQFSKKARSLGPGTVLVIYVPPSPKPEGVAYESLRGEPTPRKDLPRCR